MQHPELSRFLAQDRIDRMVDEADRNRLAGRASEGRHRRRSLATRVAAAVIHALPVTLRAIVAFGRRALPAQAAPRGAVG